MPMRVRVLTCVALVCAAAACGGKEAAEPPVAAPAVALEYDRVPIGSPLKLTYSFQVAQNASIDGDYLVFLHVLDPDNERLWTDDHAPPVPTSQWKPGQKVEYTRTIFVPIYPYVGEARLRIGLYSPESGRRLSLDGSEVGRREYLVGTLQLLPQSENIFLIYKEGWHSAEVSPTNPAEEWQWTKKAATLSFRNPRKDAVFYLRYDARTDLFSPPQQVSVRLNNEPLGSFAADSRDPALITMPITAAQLGTGDLAEIVIDVDRTFRPGAEDTRDLGIRVFNAFVDPR